MSLPDVATLPAVTLSRMLWERSLKATDLLTAVLARADVAQAELNPFSVRLDERAWYAAEAADAALDAERGGPLTGIPVSVKDSQYLAGVPSAVGSLARSDYVPHQTATPLSRLEAAGVIIFAKTTTPEFCYSGITDSDLWGPTRNPWNPERTSGGSSGGAAAAVGAGVGPLSLGGDGGGSIRIPSAFCGITGFKPSFGVVPREPSSRGWKSLVSTGPMGRSIEDIRLMLTALVGWDPMDRSSLAVAGWDSPAPQPSQIRLVVSADLGFAPVDDDIAAAFSVVLTTLERAGVDLIEDGPGLTSSAATWSYTATADARWSESIEYETAHHLLQPATLDFLAFGETVTAEQYIRAQFEREAIFLAYAQLFARTGAVALLTPTLGCEAFPHGQRYPDRIGDVDITLPWLDWAGFLYDANLAGLPSVAMPMGLGDQGLPLSLQLLGARGDDGALLAAAQTMQGVLGTLPMAPRWARLGIAAADEHDRTGATKEVS